MPLREIVRVLGGDCYDGGHQANIPRPGGPRDDRSVSLRISDGRVIVNTFSSQADWRVVLDELRKRNLIDQQNRPTAFANAGPADYHSAPASRVERRQAALAIWEAGRPALGTLTERHVRSRHIHRALPSGDHLRHNQQTPISAYKSGGRTKPAMLAAIRDPEGAIAAVEITYLDLQGRRDTRLHVPRKTVGDFPPSSAVRLDEPGVELLVAEGLFTTLSASQRFSLPAWALLATRNMRRWTPPPGVKTLVLAGDNGADGQSAAHQLADRASAMGLKVCLEFPPSRFGDWNDCERFLEPLIPRAS